ncbi:MAG: SPOR domain-containing protein [Hyphomonadaceae bacterium]|nr:SPOR domain-containing protein [Hyphomonadaceae bacterium]
MRLSLMRWALLAGVLGLIAASDVSAEAPAYGYGDARSARPTFDLRRSSSGDRAALVDDEDADEADLDADEAEQPARTAEAQTPARTPAASDRETLRAVRDPSLNGLSGAHASLPIPSVVDVSANGRFALVRIERRGGRDGEIALSPRAAETLGIGQGGRVEVRYVGAAPGGGTALAQNAETGGPASLLPPGTTPVERTTPMPVAAAPPPRAAPTQVWGAPQAYEAPRAYAGGGYMVQLGAFADPANAERVRAQVRSHGEVVVEPRRVGASELYRVRLGPWPDRARAELARRQVAALGFGDAIIAPR